MNQSLLLQAAIWSPLAFAALIALLPNQSFGQIRGLTFVGMLVNAALCFGIYGAFEPSGVEFQLASSTPWISAIGLNYSLGVDGLAATLIALTGFLGPTVVLASWTYISHRIKEFHIAILVLQTTMLGALCATDIMLFYIFFEAMLIPMYLLIGVWGAEENRQKAATKFFLYTLVGSLLMLVALLTTYFLAQPAGARTFDYQAILQGLTALNRELAQSPDSWSTAAKDFAMLSPWLFLACALAFAIKVPMFPVHTWLPDAHVQAPVAGSMILAGVMLKMGTFGFWRLAIPFFPHAANQFKLLFAVLSVIGIVYGAFMCLAQQDIKKLIAYSSVSHLGYCMLGIFALTAEGATGSAYQMLNHGVSTGALFLLFGMMYERRHSRLIADYGGIAKIAPILATLFLIVTFSSIAVPGTNGFVGEFLVLLGTVNSSLPLWIGVLGSTGVVLGAAYMLWMYQKVFFGPLGHGDAHHVTDLRPREIATALPFIALIVFMGLRPQPILDTIAPSTKRFVERASTAPVKVADIQPSRVKSEVVFAGPALNGVQP